MLLKIGASALFMAVFSTPFVAIEMFAASKPPIGFAVMVGLSWVVAALCTMIGLATRSTSKTF